MSDIREDWIATVVGKALNPDRFAGNQCVDTVDHFGEFIFGVPWQDCVGGVRGAKDLLNRAPDEYWIRIDYFHGFIPQRFDVLVYAGDSANEWGHTAVTESATKTYIDVVQQDGFAAPHQFVDGNWYSAKPAHRARLAYSARGTGPLLGVLRPRPEKLRGGITLQSTTIQAAPSSPKEWDEMATEEQVENAVVRAVRKVTKEGYGIVDSVWYRPINGWNGAVSAEARLAGADQAVNDIRAQLGAQNAQIAGLVGALSAVTKGEAFDEAKLLAGVQAAAEAGVKSAIDSIETTVTIKEG